MKIAVCIKSVLDVTFPFALDQEKLSPSEDDVFYRVNPADRCAAEVALMLQEAHGGEVIFISYGDSPAEKVLRDCLSMGGNRAIRIWEGRLDAGPRSKACLLAKAVEGLSPDLVLCGAGSLDEGTGETPAAMAEFLGFPQVTGITDLSLPEGKKTVIVSRKLERGRRERIECQLPAVLSVTPGIRNPRYGSFPNTLAAKRAKIDCLDGDDLKADFSILRGLDSHIRFESRSLPRPRPKKTFNMDSGLSAEERMELMMSGGLKQSKSDLLEGSPEEVAKKLTDILQERIK